MSIEENKGVVRRDFELVNQRYFDALAEEVYAADAVWHEPDLDVQGDQGDTKELGPPTGKQVEIVGITMHRIEDGKIVEEWERYDILSIVQPLGLVVIPGPRLLIRMLVRQAKKLRGRLRVERSS